MYACNFCFGQNFIWHLFWFWLICAMFLRFLLQNLCFSIMIFVQVYCCNPSLGLATKAKACKVVGQERSPGVTSHAPKNAKKCEKMNLHTFKWTPILEMSKMGLHVTHSQLPEGLKSEFQTKNSERARSRGTLHGSQHYRRVKGHAGAPGWD